LSGDGQGCQIFLNFSAFRLDAVFPVVEEGSTAALVPTSPGLEMYRAAKHFLLFNNPMYDAFSISKEKQTVLYWIISIGTGTP
jgi:hypothetical protein